MLALTIALPYFLEALASHEALPAVSIAAVGLLCLILLMSGDVLHNQYMLNLHNDRGKLHIAM